MSDRPFGPRAVNRADLVVALVLFGLAAIIWREVTEITRTVTYGVGPTAALKIVGGGLGVLGLFTLGNALKGRADAVEPMNAGPVWIILGSCIAAIASIRFGGGFIPAMTVLFAGTATAFGRRAYAADIGIGFAVALVIYLAFSKLLTLSLPAGPLERLIG